MNRWSEYFCLIVLALLGVILMLVIVTLSIPAIASTFPNADPVDAILIYFIPIILIIVVEHIIIACWRLFQKSRKRDLESKVSNLEERISDLEK